MIRSSSFSKATPNQTGLSTEVENEVLLERTDLIQLAAANVLLLMRAFALVVVCSGCAGTDRCVQTDARSHSRIVSSDGPLRCQFWWLSQVEAARLIDELPVWPTDRDFTADEWLHYYRLAYVFVNMPPDDVERCLDAFMVMKHQKHRVPTANWGMNPMILIRVMFALPTEHVNDASSEYQIVEHAGLRAVHPTGHAGRIGLSSPVDWRGGHPTLSAFRDSGSPAVNVHYDPRAEFVLFHSLYPYRLDELRKLIDQPIPSLDWLSALRDLEAVD